MKYANIYRYRNMITLTIGPFPTLSPNHDAFQSTAIPLCDREDCPVEVAGEQGHTSDKQQSE